VALCVLYGQKYVSKDIHKETLPIYGEHYLSRQAGHNWVQKLSEGWTIIKDEHQAGRQVERAVRACFREQKNNFSPRVSTEL